MGVLCSEDTKNQNKKNRIGNITKTNDNKESLPSENDIYNTEINNEKGKFGSRTNEGNKKYKKYKEKAKGGGVKKNKNRDKVTDNQNESDIQNENDNEIGKNFNIDSDVKVNYPNIDDNIDDNIEQQNILNEVKNEEIYDTYKPNNNNINEENKQDGKILNSKNDNNNYYLKGNANNVNPNIIINVIDTNKENISKVNANTNNEFQIKTEIKQEENTRGKYQIPNYPRDYKQIMAEKNENNKENFYDMILDFNSFEQLKVEGWNAIFTESGKQKFDKSTKENNIIIGVVGNKNRGKSFLLGRIMKMKEYQNPNGYLVTTKGISCIFPVLDTTNKTFITLDTAGKDNPLLRNAFFEEMDKNDKIRNVARDQKVTEIALNDFIIEESDVLIAVLEQLSFNEQEMLKNLINQIKNYGINASKDEISDTKRLIVIHNLMNISSVEGIEKFIHDVLLKSLTFNLKMQNIKKNGINIYSQIINQDKDSNKRPYLEIVHIIVGDDKNEEIRQKYNEPAFDFIRRNIKTQVGRKFNVLERFKDCIIENSKIYFEGEAFDKNAIILGSAKKENEKIIIPLTLASDLKDKKLNFKKLYTNSKGIHNFYSVFEPKYSTDLIELDGKNYLEIEFELSGKVEITEITPVIDKEQYIITIKGKSEEEGEKKEIKEFEFQPIINRFLPSKNKNKEIQITIPQKVNPIRSADEQYGIYNIKLLVKLTEININFEFEGNESENENENESENSKN